MPQTRTVLRLSTSLAVLRSGVSVDRSQHTVIATAMLRASTGLADLCVTRRSSGRPRLEPPYPELSVSLSFRDGLLLAGFDPLAGVGVDVEPAWAMAGADPARLARDHFAPGEAAAIGAAPLESARDLFLRLWTAKEAALKLTGRGVFDGLDEPDCSRHLAALMAGEPIALPVSDRLPACALIISRPHVDGLDAAPYCALARAIAAGVQTDSRPAGR